MHTMDWTVGGYGYRRIYPPVRRVVWVALKDADAAKLAEMQHEFCLYELAVEDARVGHQRPKIEESRDALFVIIHSVQLIDGDLHVGEVDVFVGDTYVLSNRNRFEQGFADVRARWERETHHMQQGPALSCMP